MIRLADMLTWTTCYFLSLYNILIGSLTPVQTAIPNLLLLLIGLFDFLSLWAGG